MREKNIAFLVMPDVTLLDVTGPYEVFTQAIEHQKSTDKDDDTIYRLHTISTENSKLIESASGFKIYCDELLRSVDYEIDTLFIPGIPNSLIRTYKEHLSKKTLLWIGKQSAKMRRICSVCTGTFFLAEAGLTEGKRVTTHWELCERLAKEYPMSKVDKEPIFIKDGNIYTSAGITAGMDLALALIEEDKGKTFALEVAKQMVLYLKRPGNQSQFSTVLTHQNVDFRPIKDIQEWIAQNIRHDITIELLARKARMSPRNFARVFVKETGITPAKYIEKIRIESACRLLVDTQLSIKEITYECGLGTVDNMRRQFQKYFQTTPNDYRKNFRSAY